jgi:hypothetical protein
VHLYDDIVRNFSTVRTSLLWGAAIFILIYFALSPLLSNIPVIFWNWGKVELQLTFNNV